MEKKIVVLGAGISGLAAAFQLQQKGFDVTVIEKNAECGGSMISESVEGYLVDYGPNSGLETTPVIKELVKSAGIEVEMIYANPAANKRYILRDGELRALPMNPPQFLKTNLFSTKAKLRLFAEPFIGKSNDGYYQSISEFVSRRLGREFLDYAINPFVSGVYAGDPDKLSVKSAFPKLYALEENYGGLIKGMIKGAKERKKRNEQSKQDAKMFSFKDGMQKFAKGLAEKLRNVKYNSEVVGIEKTESGYKITYKQNETFHSIETPALYSTLPAYVAAKLFGSIDAELAKHLEDIYYPPVMVLYLGYNKKDIAQELDAFGYLIPAKEKQTYLGALWSSVIFNNRAPEDMASFTIFIGGARSPQIFDKDEEELVREVIVQFGKTMGVKAEPVFMRKRFWQKAIPQYNLGYIEHERYFGSFENNFPGIFLGGNYRGGISVGDCIKNSEINSNKIAEYFNKV